MVGRAAVFFFLGRYITSLYREGGSGRQVAEIDYRHELAGRRYVYGMLCHAMTQSFLLPVPSVPTHPHSTPKSPVPPSYPLPKLFQG